MNKRLRTLRKDILKLTLKDFGTKICLSPGAIGDIENSRRQLQDRHIKLICQAFDVNEDWLRNGTEPVFIENEDDTLLTNLKNKYNLNDAFYSMLKSFLKLDEFSQNIISNYIFQAVEDYYIENLDKIDELNAKIKSLPKIEPIINNQKEPKQEMVKIVARGKDVTYLSKEEMDGIEKNSRELTMDEINDLF